MSARNPWQRGSVRIGSRLGSPCDERMNSETRPRPRRAATGRPLRHVPSAPTRLRRRTRRDEPGLAAFLFATFSINACASSGSDSPAASPRWPDSAPLGRRVALRPAEVRRHASSRLPSRSRANALFASTRSRQDGSRNADEHASASSSLPIHRSASAPANSAPADCWG